MATVAALGRLRLSCRYAPAQASGRALKGKHQRGHRPSRPALRPSARLRRRQSTRDQVSPLQMMPPSTQPLSVRPPPERVTTPL